MDEALIKKIPPHSVEAERAVIGSMMMDKDAILVSSEILSAEDFYQGQYGELFTALVELYRSGVATDLVTLQNKLREMDTVPELSSTEFLANLTLSVPTSANIKHYADIVHEKAVLRRLIQTTEKVSNTCYLDNEPLEDILDRTEKEVFDVLQQRSASEFEPISQVVLKTLDEISQAAKQDGHITGLETGFYELDYKTAGLQKSDLILIAARPAMGKTAFVLSMAKNIAVDYRNPVALFSLEMSNVQLVNRLITNVCEIPSEKIKSGQLASYEWQQLDYKLKDLLDAPLYVDDTPSLSVFELRTKARRLVREHGVRIIIIDYLQLMNASGMAFGSRQEEVSTISRSLKGLAKELNIPIIALSQLNRGVESREGIDGKRPQLSDLRESGAIEQDADMVCFIHRPEYYKIYSDEKGNDLHGMAEIIIAKHRNGAVGDVLLRFRGEFARFQNPDDDVIVPMPGEAPGIIRSKMNGGGNSVPPPSPDAAPADNNPFGAPIPEGPLPF